MLLHPLLGGQLDTGTLLLLPPQPSQDEPGAVPRKQILLIQRYCNRYWLALQQLLTGYCKSCGLACEWAVWTFLIPSDLQLDGGWTCLFGPCAGEFI